MFKKSVFILLASLFSTSSWAAGGNDGNNPTVNSNLLSTNATQVSVLRGLNIKLLPAFYWGSVGVEVEYPFAEKISAGVLVNGSFGRTDNSAASFTLRPEEYLQSGFSFDAFARYYIKGEAPEGLYGQFNIGYNTMLFFDGNTRAYTMHNRWKELSGFRVPNDLLKPKPFNATLGMGYQLIVIPKHVIANAVLGVQGQMDADSQFFISVYVVPTIGWVF